MSASQTHDPDQDTVKAPPKSVALLTCSMAGDLDIFGLLADSVDRHVEPSIRHDVVVPKTDLAVFKRFETSRRRVLAQEDVLPVRLMKLPKAPRLLARIKAGFRRPLYLTARGQLVRGWMVQQCLKIEMSRRIPETAIMHVDSDVAFVRDFQSEDAFEGNLVRFFRADGETRNPMHRPWVQTACDFLGVEMPDSHRPHYIENCVLWSTAVARAMAERVEAEHNCPLHDVIFRAQTMSEYYLYGIYVDLVADNTGLLAEDVSFCKSYWPNNESDPFDADALMHGYDPKQRAIAVQSTNQLDLDSRRSLYARAERALAGF
ncbi:MAG: hypothetical protein COW54_00120 [Rhodobacteraceae bacterium CG17_big_fil_post_rev_8_21_14_2_50_63_15]|nr:MAG: hypothetical protein COW54_00120 [Rhodobacteraceae bacterium CG17_big_fil_post_rev_8_21_14_2_50_63_15]